LFQSYFCCGAGYSTDSSLNESKNSKVIEL